MSSIIRKLKCDILSLFTSKDDEKKDDEKKDDCLAKPTFYDTMNYSKIEYGLLYPHKDSVMIYFIFQGTLGEWEAIRTVFDKLLDV